MSEQGPRGRIACVRSTDKNFYLAVKRPVNRWHSVYKELDFFAEGRVRTLSEGSQIFRYPRENFGHFGDSPEKEFVDYVKESFRALGNIALDPNLIPVSAKVASEKFAKV